MWEAMRCLYEINCIHWKLREKPFMVIVEHNITSDNVMIKIFCCSWLINLEDQIRVWKPQKRRMKLLYVCRDLDNYIETWNHSWKQILQGPRSIKIEKRSLNQDIKIGKCYLCHVMFIIVMLTLADYMSGFFVVTLTSYLQVANYQLDSPHSSESIHDIIWIGIILC